MNEAITTVTRIEDGSVPFPDADELKALLKALKAGFHFKPARTLLAMARERDPGNLFVAQQLALCTYKDEDLPPDIRFRRALDVLEEIGLREPDEFAARYAEAKCSLTETLALGGAVYKRRFEFDGQLDHLHQALGYYRAAWDTDPEQDLGYGGINAAYILDLIASRMRALAARQGVPAEKASEAKKREDGARALREEIATRLEARAKAEPALLAEHWFLATLAEAHLGLGDYARAAQHLAAARALEPDPWEMQTTFRQLVGLARLQEHRPPPEGQAVEEWAPVWKALHAYLGDDTATALGCHRGKVGLALSGGGFRASLFHLGVLARLAEMDVLRSVEVLSTVSGGSIVGAHYYLELKALLESKADAEIRRDDYIALVDRVRERFLAGVQKNVRVSVLDNLVDNLRMIFTKAYSRSHRLGDLYESLLYAEIGTQPRRETPRSMSELVINPVGEKGFHPKFSNWRRSARVPVLLLNATSLNSGHSWQFTARSMGEPPGAVHGEVDVNERYRRLNYEQAPLPELKTYRLGHAVAASSCVPGLFEPLVLEGLYPGRTIRLVDGGVHDNQGVSGLLNEGCTAILCSDASGQMSDERRPTDTMLGVPLRANSILMDRVREAEYQDLQARVESGALQGLFFIHMKQDLDSLPIDWIECQDPTSVPPSFPATTPYGVDRDLQRRLAAIRTDLDSFSEVEANALMLSGYLMTEHQFEELQREHERDGKKGKWGEYDVTAERGRWRFRLLESLIRQPPDASDARRQDLERQLEAGAALFFKIWVLSPVLRKVAVAAGAAALAALAWLVWTSWNVPVLDAKVTWGVVVLMLAGIALGIVVPVVKWLQPDKAVRGYLWKFVVAVAGFLFARLHLAVFDRIFLRRGRLERLLKLP